MSKYHYQLPVDSKTGKKLSHFWHLCMKCEQEAEKYAKKMGGQYYYSDPRYFAGGVSFISFPDNKPKDAAMWREIGKIGDEEDVVYFEPNVTKRIDWEEIPTKDYRPQNSFDCIYGRQPVEKDGKWYLQCIRFEYDEEPGLSHNSPRVASRTVRRAIKAEMQRTKLPVMRVEPLLNLLGADWLQTETVDGKPQKSPETTPTFFVFENHYYIGCDYECKADGLKEISPQTHRTYQCKYEWELKKKAN